MNLLSVLLFISSLSCTLVTGFLFTYAVVVMPGISKLGDKEFLRAFQVTDEVIQNNQPLFMLTWIGSIISVIGLIISSLISLGLTDAWLIVSVGIVYLLGVQGITISVHLPLNNRIQKLKIDELDDKSLNEQRLHFESRWNYFNNIRTIIAFFVNLVLLLIITSK
ncbi:DUF1772 domain-containing protein [Bacteriovoracales bacterium]|nr:DUF1772 domain-containing protein [Bacteriovoracales bacterium]